MKKVFSIIALSAMTLSLSSFDEINNDVQTCSQFARAEVYSLANFLGEDPNTEHFDWYMDYYENMRDACLND